MGERWLAIGPSRLLLSWRGLLRRRWLPLCRYEHPAIRIYFCPYTKVYVAGDNLKWLLIGVVSRTPNEHRGSIFRGRFNRLPIDVAHVAPVLHGVAVTRCKSLKREGKRLQHTATQVGRLKFKKCLILMVPAERIELPTNGLQSRRSRCDGGEFFGRSRESKGVPQVREVRWTAQIHP
jgi:hypothetical protein